MLHLVFKSPLEPMVLERMATGDSVVFLNDAVYNLLANNPLASGLSDPQRQKHYYALNEDLTTRGITHDLILPNVSLIDYRQLVDLTVKHTPIQSWF